MNRTCRHCTRMQHLAFYKYMRYQKKNLTKSNAEKRKLFEFFISQGTYVHCTRPSEGNKAKINNKPSKKGGLKWIFYINIPL